MTIMYRGPKKGKEKTHVEVESYGFYFSLEKVRTCRFELLTINLRVIERGGLSN